MALRWSSSRGPILDLADYECPLCLKLLVRPTTTPCGHSFCHRCLVKALESRYTCPLCRHDFEEFPLLNPNILLVSLIEKYWPTEAFERQCEQEVEERAEQVTRAIFFVTRQLALRLLAQPMPEEGNGPGTPHFLLEVSFLGRSLCPYSAGAPIPTAFYIDHVIVRFGAERMVLPGPEFLLYHIPSMDAPLVVDVHFQPRFQHAPLRLRQSLRLDAPAVQVVDLQFDSRLMHT
eukprot:GGOE01019677.1.p1 GENE.GGOE01019677.1~~GGOE01019677.1.p1  ORF type:complete len:233 (-),score=65.54 GGOE01019677.1:316-1014(-)